LSNIIRHTRRAPKVSIGEMHLDFQKEVLAEQELSRVFPEVSVVTGADGAKMIPIQETFKMVPAFEDQTQAAHRSGHEEGYQTGLNQGREEGRAEAERVLRQFQQAIKDTVEQRETLLREAKSKILDLVMQISRKVTFEAVSVDPRATLSIINGVVDSLVDRSKLKIKVNPEHLPLIEQNMERLKKESSTFKEISVEPDPRVRYGGCFIETPTGDIDARLESQLEVIEETLLSGEE